MNSIERTGILFCLSAPSGGGKTRLCQEVLSSGLSGLFRSVSMTSRPARAGEVQGQSYYFVSPEEFQKKIATGELVEWEEVHGSFYGTPKAPLEAALKRGDDILLPIDIRGSLRLKELFPGSVVLTFLAPPSWEILVARLKARGDVSESDLAVRFKTAQAEYEAVQRSKAAFDYLLVNDDLVAAVAAFCSVIVAERLRLNRINPLAVERLCQTK